MSWSSGILAALLGVVIGLGPGLSASAQDSPRRQKRIALVVGNATYEAGALSTPANDAGLVAQTLQAAGFDVVGARDLDEDSLRKALRDFTDKAQSSGPDTVAFIYLAGYGLQLAGENYFVPVDARIPAAADVPSRSLRLSDYTRQLAALPLAARFVVLDGARNAPFARTGDPLAGGLALAEAEPGSLIAFNASPGTVGPDEKGPYGGYATALVEMIREGGLTPAQVFDRVRLRVDETTKGAEVPWHSSRVEARFAFFERAADAPPIGRPEEVASLRSRPLGDIGARDAYAVCLQRDSIDGYQEFVQAYPRDDMAQRVRALIAARREAVTWRRTWMADSRDAYWSYLDRYPRGPHAWDARRRLGQLSAALEPPPRFVAISYDVPPPPPEEIVYVERPALSLEDPIYALAPPPPPPPVFLPPQPAYIVELAPPPTPVAFYALPTPLFVPVPTYVSAPNYVAPPPNNVIYQNIHNVTVINTLNERTLASSRDPGSAPAISPGLAAGTGAVAGAALGAAAARVALPPAVAQKAALRSPPTRANPDAPGPFGNPQPGMAQPNTAQPGPPNPLPGAAPGRPNTPLGVAGRNPPGQALPGANGQPLPGQQQAGRPGVPVTNPAAPDAKGKPEPQQAGRPLPGANGQPLPPEQIARPGTGQAIPGATGQPQPPRQAVRPGTAPLGIAQPDAAQPNGGQQRQDAAIQSQQRIQALQGQAAVQRQQQMQAQQADQARQAAAQRQQQQADQARQAAAQRQQQMQAQQAAAQRQQIQAQQAAAQRQQMQAQQAAAQRQMQAQQAAQQAARQQQLMMQRQQAMPRPAPPPGGHGGGHACPPGIPCR